MYTSVKIVIIMSYSPYIPNITAWKDHVKRATKEHMKFYTISHVKQLGEKLEPIKLVTPTESVVEQARSTVRRMRADGDAQFLLPSQPQRSSQYILLVTTTSTEGQTPVSCGHRECAYLCFDYYYVLCYHVIICAHSK